MFDNADSKDRKIISLGLGNPVPRPASPAAPPTPQPKAEVKPPVLQVCMAQAFTLEGMYLQFAGTHRKFEDMVWTGLKPDVFFYVVFPQPGLTHSVTSPDGLKTIVPLFTSKAMAEAYITGKKLGAVAAACRLENASSQAEQWMSSGINSYALNVCSRCLLTSVFPVAELQSEDQFLTTWRMDLANRRQFAEGYGRNAAAMIGTNAKQARACLEGIRDHIDPGNPYLHWVIAVLAGLAGDMEANQASIKKLEAFGPAFTGKLQGTSFDPTVPGSQAGTMGEALLGLGLSLGYLDAAKLAQKSKEPNA